MDETYRIRVSGHLDDRWADWFGGLDLQRLEDGTTVLVGPVVDQAALHGVLACIRDLGLPLLAINRETESDGRTPARGQGGDGEGASEGTVVQGRLGDAEINHRS